MLVNNFLFEFQIEDMITPPERTVLQKVNQQKDILVCGIFNVDETIFVLQEYLNCQALKNASAIPIKK